MQSLDALGQIREITTILSEISTIAVVGLSPKPQRPSNMVGKYLIDAGYDVYPVNPGHDAILGRQCYPDLASIPKPVDMVDIFRRSEDILPVVERILEMNPLPRSVWMQQGIVNEKAAELAREKGLYVVMDRCIKVDHANYLR